MYILLCKELAYTNEINFFSIWHNIHLKGFLYFILKTFFHVIKP